MERIALWRSAIAATRVTRSVAMIWNAAVAPTRPAAAPLAISRLRFRQAACRVVSLIAPSLDNPYCTVEAWLVGIGFVLQDVRPVPIEQSIRKRSDAKDQRRGQTIIGPSIIRIFGRSGCVTHAPPRCPNHFTVREHFGIRHDRREQTFPFGKFFLVCCQFYPIISRTGKS